MPQVDVSGERVGFFSVNQDLHASDRGQIHCDGVDDGVGRKQFVERPAGMFGPDVPAQINKGLAAFADEQRAQRGPRPSRR